MKYKYWSWENYFTKKDIKNINNFIDNNFNCYEDPIYIATDKTNKNKKNVLVKCISYNKIKKYLKNLLETCLYVNKKNFGYDLFNSLDNGYCNLNIYSADKLQSYDWHIDAVPHPYEDIKFTILINLSMKPYEGGKFKIFDQYEKDVNELDKPGNVIMFKSYLNHKVTPIIKGERRTLAIFLNGPNFK